MRSLLLASAALAVSGCVSQEIRDSARAACEARQTPPEAMGACMEQMEAAVLSARHWRPPSTPPNQN